MNWEERERKEKEDRERIHEGTLTTEMRRVTTWSEIE